MALRAQVKTFLLEEKRANQVHKAQVIFARAAPHAALAKITVFYPNAKRCKARSLYGFAPHDLHVKDAIKRLL